MISYVIVLIIVSAGSFYWALKTEKPKCKVPECDWDAESWSNKSLCEYHWDMWMNWPMNKPEPDWMKEQSESIQDEITIRGDYNNNDDDPTNKNDIV